MGLPSLGGSKEGKGQESVFPIPWLNGHCQASEMCLLGLNLDGGAELYVPRPVRVQSRHLSWRLHFVERDHVVQYKIPWL